MLRLTSVRSEPLTATESTVAVRLSLVYDDRVRSRLASMLSNGTAVAILLPRGTVLRSGSVLSSDDGTLALVEAAPQPLARITASAPLQLLRAVYHLANRHVPAQLCIDHVLIERDPVLERMLVALGASIEHAELPFEPEAGAYFADEHGSGHSHGTHHDEVDDVSATVGEQLSIAAHRASAAPRETR